MFQYISSFFVAPTANQAEDATNAATTTEGVENNVRLVGKVEDDWLLVGRDCDRHSDFSSVESLNNTREDLDESFDDDRIEVDLDGSFDMIPGTVREGAAAAAPENSRGTGAAVPYSLKSSPLHTRTSSVSSAVGEGRRGGTTPGAAMDESWFLTPPPCFVSTGPPLDMATSPLENLLIEHPSMSVYYSHNDDDDDDAQSQSSSSSSASSTPSQYKFTTSTRRRTVLAPLMRLTREDFCLPIDLNDRELLSSGSGMLLQHLKSYSDSFRTSSHLTLERRGNKTRLCRRIVTSSNENRRRAELQAFLQSEFGMAEVDENVRVDHENIQYWRDQVKEARRMQAAEEEEYQLKKAQLVTKRRVQKAKKQQTAGRGRMVLNNKAREVNGRNRKERRGERSQGARRSCANNNRKC